MLMYPAAGKPLQENRDEQRQQGIEKAQAGDAGEDAGHGHSDADAGEWVQTRAAQEVANNVTDPAVASPLPRMWNNSST